MPPWRESDTVPRRRHHVGPYGLPPNLPGRCSGRSRRDPLRLLRAAHPEVTPRTRFRDQDGANSASASSASRERRWPAGRLDRPFTWSRTRIRRRRGRPRADISAPRPRASSTWSSGQIPAQGRRPDCSVLGAAPYSANAVATCRRHGADRPPKAEGQRDRGRAPRRGGAAFFTCSRRPRDRAGRGSRHLEGFARTAARGGRVARAAVLCTCCGRRYRRPRPNAYPLGNFAGWDIPSRRPSQEIGSVLSSAPMTRPGRSPCSVSSLGPGSRFPTRRARRSTRSTNSAPPTSERRAFACGGTNPSGSGSEAPLPGFEPGFPP